MLRHLNQSVLIAALLATVAYADEVQVDNGEIKGRILSDRPDAVVIRTLAGEEVAVSRDAILKVARQTEVENILDRGAFMEGKGLDENAYLEYVEVLRRDPTNAEANRRMDEITQRHQQERWETGMKKARELVATERYRKALRAFQAVLAQEPDDHLAQQVVEEMCNTYAKIAYMYYNHCYDEGAITELAKAEELNPNSPEIYYLLGRIHETGGHVDLAKQEYERALELEPAHFESRERLNYINERQRRALRAVRRSRG